MDPSFHHREGSFVCPSRGLTFVAIRKGQSAAIGPGEDLLSRELLTSTQHYHVPQGLRITEAEKEDGKANVV